MHQNLLEILEAREARAARQKELLRQYGKPLVCFTMNIPGPVKVSPLITRGFQYGCRLLRALPALHREQRCTAAGWEGFWVVDAPAEDIKKLCAHIEDHDPMGRVFDMDVLTARGEKCSRAQLGLPVRKCLLCKQDAMVCSRSRAHSLEALQAETFRLIGQGLQEALAETAVKALLCELYATPKPGLVDRANSGSHQDMDLFTFLRSAAALWPYFRECAGIGLTESDPQAVMAALRKAGKEAEEAMFRATGGVNTHKGAIFSMGILCGAAAMLMPEQWESPEAVAAQCQRLTEGLCARDFAGITPETARTFGEKLYALQGITGARGQAEAGFPAAWQVGLPILEAGLAGRISWNDSLCAALLHILAATQDTNLIKRGGRHIQDRVRVLLKETPYPGSDALEDLDGEFIAAGLSPGGSADLLAATCFFYFLKTPNHLTTA